MRPVQLAAHGTLRDSLLMFISAKSLKRACLGATLGLISLSTLAEDVYPVFEVYLTAEANNNRPGLNAQTDFECADKIYAVVKVSAPGRQKKSEHLLIVNWLNPGDRLEQKTRYPFNFYGKSTMIWAWLKLSGSTGSSIGQIFDPAFGMDEFIGQWRAEFIIDDKKIATLPFEVLC